MPFAQPALGLSLSGPRSPHQSLSFDPVPDAHLAHPLSVPPFLSVGRVGPPLGVGGTRRWALPLLVMDILSEWEGETL